MKKKDWQPRVPRNKIQVQFTEEEFLALRKWADDMRRHPRDQIVHCVLLALQERDYLPTTDNTIKPHMII